MANLFSFSAKNDSMRLVNKNLFYKMDSELKTFIGNMLPPDLEKIQSFVDYLLPIKINNRTTNLDYLERMTKVCCPKCHGNHIKKNGHKNHTQRYWCHDCKKSFSLTDHNVIRYSSINYNQLKMLFRCMYDYKPLKEIALEVGISKTSVFELEIKIFNALDELYDKVKLKEVVQADELYVRTSFKGCKKNMPRKSRYDGHTELTTGISKDQVCVIVAIDSFDNLIIKVVGNGNASTEMISNALENKVEENSILVTDSKSSYKQFALENNLKLIQIPSEKHKIDNYTINDVNEIITEITTYLNVKRGVSSRHLQHHLNFIKYRKIMKYTYEYLELNEKMYKDSLCLYITLKSNDVYSTPMPFDLDDYEKWCKENGISL